MANGISSDSGRAGSSLLRKLIIGLAGLLVLLVLVYFVVSSSAFVKGVVLPRVSKSLNAEVTVETASLSPFSKLVLTRLKVQPTGREPLLTAEEVRVRYSLLAIVRGNYTVNELTLLTPVIQIVEEPDGSSNLDPVVQGDGSPRPAEPASTEPLQARIQNVSVKDGTLRSISKASDGTLNTTELAGLNVTLDRLANGEAGKLTIATAMKMTSTTPAHRAGTNDVLEGKVDGAFDFKMDQQLLPQTLTGKAILTLNRAEGAYAELAGLRGDLQADVTPTEIRQVALRFQRAGNSLGEIYASGPLEIAKSEGRLKLEVKSIDRQVLNLFGAPKGWDFADSVLNATNHLELARGGELIAAKGQVVGRQLSIRETNQATPPVNLDVDYDVTVNLDDQEAIIRALTLRGERQGKQFLQASLDRPMTVTWASTARGFAESTFQLALTQVNLRDWQAVLGTNNPAGILDLQLSTVAKNDGKELDTQAKIRLQEAALQLGTNRIENATVDMTLHTKLQNLKVVDLEECKLELSQGNQKLASANGSAHYVLEKGDLNLHLNAELILPPLLRQFHVAELNASNGVVRLSSGIRQVGDKYSVTGDLSLGDFTGTWSGYAFQGLQSGFRYNVDYEAPRVQIHNASLDLRKGYKSAGSVSITGTYDLEKESARLNFEMLDLNENFLSSILTPEPSEKRLLSISMSGSGLADYQPSAESSLQANLSITNWSVALHPAHRDPPKLSAQLKVDGSMRQETIDLKQLLLTLSPTARAKNELDIKARLDFGTTNATPSQFTVRADSLDLTPYYLMFAGNQATNAAGTAPPAGRPATPPAASPQAPPTEPEPAPLPFQQLTADVQIGRLFLSEVAITNLQAAAKVNRGEVTLQPVAMTLNGAPVSATAMLNLGVPGYIYDVAFKADKVPLDPLSITFTTNAPGTFQGDLIADVQIKGAGVTGPNLRKNLDGALNVSLTNMHYEIVGRKVKRLLEPIALVLRVPELTQTPLNWIAAKAALGQGQINLQQFTVKSDAFLAESRGAIPIADVLTNSPLKLPVSLSLSRSLAAKANLLDPTTPTNAAYAPLPTFVTLEGTLGEPKTEINKVVVGGLLAKSIGGIAPLGDKAGNILQGVGGILSGQPAGTNNPAARTNSPANIVQDITNLLLPPKKDSAGTNAPAASTNKPARINPLDLLRGLPEKKQ